MRRDSKGFSLIEMVVAVTILTVVVSLLYLYSNKGLLFYEKIFNFDRVQINVKSTLETVLNNLREASRSYVHIGSGYNSRVPVPDDLIISEPYLYFAKYVSDSDQAEVRGIKDKIDRKVAGYYDYYLVYLSKVEKDSGEYFTDKARLKFLVFTNQSIDNTDFNANDWPFLPYLEDDYTVSLFSIGLDEDEKQDTPQKLNRGFLDYVSMSGSSPVFSISNSEIEFDYFNSNNLINKTLIKFKINIKDERENVILDLESAVMPRN